MAACGLCASVWAQSPTLATEPPPSDADAVAPVTPKPGFALPLWEAGVAVVGVQGPDYPAASTSRWRGAAAPIFIYRGDRFRVDDDGVRSRLLKHGEFEFDLSGAAAFNSRNSEARDGMPARDYTFELGPQALYRVPLGGGQQVSAHLKLRQVFSTNWRNIHGRGQVLEPELRWRIRGWPGARSQVQLSLQASWASEALQDYFYQVDPIYARPNRPAYDARGGFFGSAVRAGWSHRLNPTTAVSFGVSVNDHSGAANRNSPLFQRQTTASVVAAVVWAPLRSAEFGQP